MPVAPGLEDTDEVREKNTDEFKKNFSNWSPDASAMNKQLKLFAISVGTEDFLYESVKQNIAIFREKQPTLRHSWCLEVIPG